MPGRILIVEDDATHRYAISRLLEKDGFSVDVVDDGQAGLDAARAGEYDVVLLDWTLPNVSGIDVCRTLRAESPVPIIMLSARGTEAERVLGLELGADDYVTKPFSSAELVSRIRSLMRRRAIDTSDDRRLRIIGGVALDLVRHSATVDGRPVAFTPTEFRLVSLLSSEPERVFSREEIMRHLWQSAFVGDTRNVDVHVRNVRRKIEGDPAQPERLVTVRGVGYQLRPV
ncbi:MAG TPA: response regulator transcription factor [Solirubrobacteraceae bacterium]|jgi:two-component system response regulator RegX3|nr:response regulator transcription factor [Solirubrobacteraceae bacterium]